EISDNVIPASNSSMAKCLFLLGHYFNKQEYIQKTMQMLHNVKPNMIRYGSGYSNWAQLLCWQVYPFYEVAISGPFAIERLNELNNFFVPNVLIAVSE